MNIPKWLKRLFHKGTTSHEEKEAINDTIAKTEEQWQEKP